MSPSEAKIGQKIISNSLACLLKGINQKLISRMFEH